MKNWNLSHTSSSSFLAEAFLTVHHYPPSLAVKMCPIDLLLLLLKTYPKGMDEWSYLDGSPFKVAWHPASLRQHKCPCMCFSWRQSNGNIAQIVKNMIWYATSSSDFQWKPFGEEEDSLNDTYTYTEDACVHSNTTSFVVNAFAPPHTIKVPIKGHYGFSTSSNHRESSSTARPLRAHRCLLCCHPKELRLIDKVYDHNYWSKIKVQQQYKLGDSGKTSQVGLSERMCLWDVHPEIKYESKLSDWSHFKLPFTTRGRHFPDMSSDMTQASGTRVGILIKKDTILSLFSRNRVSVSHQPQSPTDLISHHRWKRWTPYLLRSISSPPCPKPSSTRVCSPERGPKASWVYASEFPSSFPSSFPVM